MKFYFFVSIFFNMNNKLIHLKIYDLIENIINNAYIYILTIFIIKIIIIISFFVIKKKKLIIFPKYIYLLILTYNLVGFIFY